MEKNSQCLLILRISRFTTSILLYEIVYIKFHIILTSFICCLLLYGNTSLSNYFRVAT